ncbi:MAG: methyltransferase domain-containing protein, partial [Flavobacteriaceae bacterium]|nr:methyltransferase domain-containing protein [Flavobacteriaceae bacterium]
GNMQYLYYPEPFLENYLVGLDYNKDALTLAKSMLNRINNGFLVCCIGEFLPFKKHCFDVVLCIDTLSYLKNTYLMIIEEMYEISKKQIILNVHHEDAAYEERFKFFNEKEIAKILEDNGFSVIDIHIISARENYGIDSSKNWPSHLEPPDTKMYIHIKAEK